MANQPFVKYGTRTRCSGAVGQVNHPPPNPHSKENANQESIAMVRFRLSNTPYSHADFAELASTVGNVPESWKNDGIQGKAGGRSMDVLCVSARNVIYFRARITAQGASP
jgi:hypothetical protein